jgi:hypothetical protein
MDYGYTSEEFVTELLRKQAQAGFGTEFNIDKRDVVLTRDVVHTREVCKDIKIKRNKHSSRVQDDEDGDVSKDLLASAASPQKPLEESLCQKAFGNVITPVRTTSRYSGVSVQHCRTRKGVKLSITLQQPDEVELGACLRLTAELKRYDRLHEVKARPEDSEWFGDLLHNTQADIRASQDRTACLGRIHDRGQRSEWFLDSLVVGFMDGPVVRRVWLNLEGEEYILELDQELSDRQQELYHSTRIQGHISKGRAAQRRLSTAQRVRFGD